MVQSTVAELGVNQTVVDVSSDIEKYIMDQTNSLGSRTFGLRYALGFISSSIDLTSVGLPAVQTMKSK